MMLKLSKNAKNLISDNEQRGRGLRIKLASSKRLLSDSDSNNSDEDKLPIEDFKKSKKNDIPYPSFPPSKKSIFCIF